MMKTTICWDILLEILIGTAWKVIIWFIILTFTIFLEPCTLKIPTYLNVSEYDREMPQSQTADQSNAPWERATGHLQ